MPNFRDEKAIVPVVKDYTISLMAEVMEVIQELNFRMHRSHTKGIDRSNIIEELTDCQKYLFGLYQVLGFSWEDFHGEFLRKSAVVSQRYEQERTLPGLINWPCCLIDIDGCLTRYPDEYYKWCIKNFYPSYSFHEFSQLYKKMDLVARETMKTRYRQSGEKKFIPLAPGAKELLDVIRRKSKLKIILITNRPYAKHYQIYPDTLFWLKENDLPFDALCWSRDKGLDSLKQFRNICWAVDDDQKNVERFREAGITTIHVQNDREGRTTMDLYKLAEGIKKMEDVGYEWQRFQNNREPQLNERE